MNDNVTNSMLYILIALDVGQKHGYGIVKWVNEKSGKFTLKSGSVYGVLSRMIDKDLIVKSDKVQRRQYYCITSRGRDVLRQEIARVKDLIKVYASSIVLQS